MRCALLQFHSKATETNRSSNIREEKLEGQRPQKRKRRTRKRKKVAQSRKKIKEKEKENKKMKKTEGKRKDKK